MQARVGDRLVVESKSAESHRVEGQIIDVRGPDGAPPYLVRWSDGREGLMFPGADAHVIRQG